MKDKSKARQELIQELVSLRKRITELEQLESVRKQADIQGCVARKVLELLTRPQGSMDIIRNILQLIQKNTGLEAVGIRLLEGDDFPYYVTNGFSEDFIQAERYLCARDAEEKIIHDGQGLPVLECMCGNILRGRTDPTQPFFTRGGSFWSNCTTELLASTTEEDRQARTRNRCNGEGYESVALIPLRSGNEIIGLLQFNDRRRNQFTPEMIRFFEGIGASVGIALFRKRAEEALRESEQWLNSIIDGSPIPAFVIGKDHRIIHWNKALEEMSNIKSGEVIGTREHWKAFYNEERPCLADLLVDETVGLVPQWYSGKDIKSPLIENAYEATDFFPAIGQDGKWLRFTAAVIRDSKGMIVAAIETLEDVTERKQAEEALKESEERYHRIADTVTDYIFTSSIEEGKVVNTVHGPGCIAVTGYSAEEFAADPYLWFNMVFPEDRDHVKKYALRILTSKNLDPAEHRIRRKDGRVRWVLNTPVPHYDSSGTLTSYDGLISDITLRKEAEEALRKSEEIYRLLVENANEAILVIQDGMVKFVNSRAVASFGYSEQEFLSTPIVEFIHPEDQEVIMERYRQKINGDRTPTRHIHRTIHKSGQIRWIEISSVLIEWEGRPATMNLVTDITERRKAGEERRMFEERLQRADKMEAIGTLAGGIAHDFNNLLMGIQGYASLTLLDLDPSHPHYERLKRIEEQVQSGADLTKQLLGFARGGRYEVKPADMNDILKKSSSMFGRTKKEITIHRKYGRDLSAVEVDRGQMEQVFMNLHVNAWQAMPGGGQIYLETEDVLLSDEQAISYSVKPGKYVKITVTDTGTGMDEKTRERIFDPFFTTKGMGRGTGLGLATVYGIIKGHKGAINVYSEPGHGTTFNIYLPASEREVVGEKTETGTIAMGTETILLVDDEKMVLEVSREMLESLGYRVYATGSGQEGLAVYMEKQKEIDLVILDMIMPGISGGETFDRLREINPATKVLLSSGYSIKGEAKKIMDRGCNGFIQKPFQFEKLSGKVREVLD